MYYDGYDYAVLTFLVDFLWTAGYRVDAGPSYLIQQGADPQPIIRAADKMEEYSNKIRAAVATSTSSV